MKNKTVACALLGAFLLGLGGIALHAAVDDGPPERRREAARKAFENGNFADAYRLYSALAADRENGAADSPLPEDFNLAVQSLQRLGRVDEVDAFRERVVSAHPAHFRGLQEQIKSLRNVEQNGFIVANQFYRGGRRGNDGRYVNTIERDRVRALQLLVQAMPLAAKVADKHAVSEYWFLFAEALLDSRYGNGAWRLQTLTDLSTLPDYGDGYRYYGYGYGQTRGAPADEAGNPVYHALPKGWEAARTDGERWRWCLMQAAEASPDQAARARTYFAAFLRQQFDVQTMAQFGYGRGRGFGYVEDEIDAAPRAGADDGDAAKGQAESKAGPYSVSTLGEDETIARLATGIKRFKLPDEFNFIKIYQDLAAGKDAYAEQALHSLAGIFTDRQQYTKAADCWRQSIQRFGAGQWKQQQLHQITGNWGKFDPTSNSPAGEDATVGFLFRNGKKVTFTAHEIKVRALLDDVKAYIKSRPAQLDWQKLDVQNVGYRLVERNEVKYVGDEVARWDLALTPRDNHYDKRVTVRTPLKKSGAYLVTAKMEDGNESRVILWVADTLIVKKPLDSGTYYFVADAKTGAPVAKANVEFFGYRQEHVRDNRFNVDVQQFAEFTDAAGQLQVRNAENRNSFTYLIIATTPDGRFAYHGFTHLWSGRYYDSEYDQTKAFVITDRPVYRPNQAVKFKAWLGRAKYDQPANAPSADAGQTVHVQINNPKGEKVLEQNLTADEYGGVAGEFAVAADATLGVYGVQVAHHGGASFRVEEYKKPEFEVKVDAPAEPVMLGEKVTATINARYYFGAPVAEAKVKYKVIRTEADASWYPANKWDWFYGPGYWWFGYDYNWYPGFREWGCCRPAPWWYYGGPRNQPEVVMENEVPVGADGTVKVEIDTGPAKALHGDHDHQYAITAEVTDASRRTMVGTGTVSVSRKPFKVYAWVDRGYYLGGDMVRAEFSAQSLDHKPVKGKGTLKLFKVEYDNKLQPIEKLAQKWEIGTNEEGRASQSIQAAQPGQYRLSYTVTDGKNRSIEGGYVFVVRGRGFRGDNLRFNDVELVAEKKEYAPGEKVRLMINANRPGATVVLFTRPANGMYLPPKVVRLPEGAKSTVEEIEVVKKDMPNFFVEAFTVGDGNVFAETREIVVPPENRTVNVEVLASSGTYKPGQKAKMQVRLTDANGEPVVGSAVVSVYDKSVEYIAGGSNVPEIKAFFWKWRRHHSPNSEISLKYGTPVARSNETQMQYLGQFGAMVADLALGDKDAFASRDGRRQENEFFQSKRGFAGAAMKAMRGPAAPSAAMEMDALGAVAEAKESRGKNDAGGDGAVPLVEPTVRKNFADTALWVASLTTNRNGVGEVELTMPENLTTWKTRVWTMASGTRVGQGEVEVVTTKDLLVRLQAPRFFTQKDEVVLSANVHNYLDTPKRVKVTLEIDELNGASTTSLDAKIERVAGRYGWGLSSYVDVPAKGEARADWRVRVDQPGRIAVRMKAQTDVESDAMEMSFPVNVHGMLKTDSYAGAMRPGDKSTSLMIKVPKERLVEHSRLEIRYSPSVAAAMVDALPYLVDYPYGCTEQTLNRFVPTVVTQRTLLAMGLDLKAIRDKRTNLNAQEIGDDRQRAQDWKRNNKPNPGVEVRNPVFDEAVVADMVKTGVTRLTNMQCSDGGWGWFSGYGEYSSPHTTAVVVHGLQIARENDVAIVPGVIERGVEWLKRYQDRQVEMLKNAPSKKDPYKTRADNLDALAFMVLTDAGVKNEAMLEFLYRDRVDLAVYSKATYGLALHKLGEKAKLDMVMQNLSQFLVNDDENQTAYLRLPENNYWWYWYGTDTEANAYYLKLLAKTDPQGEIAPRLAKYLINNRKHATYWNSTRDTATCVEALAEYVKAGGEDRPDMTLTVLLDGRKLKAVKITKENLFNFDNSVVLTGADVPAGDHRIEFAKTGTGPLYFNAYVTNFTLEDPIKRAGLEVKVNRQFYRLVPVKDATAKVAGQRGQAVEQRVEKYKRQPLKDGDTLVSGELVEVELEIDSKNDYEYLMFEDMKAAGFEPVEVRSGYNGNDLRAYMELRDERVCFFTQKLARGKHSVAYRLRAEIPGRFSALPAKASAMYAPELKANSDEHKLNIRDSEPLKKPTPSELPAASGR